MAFARMLISSWCRVRIRVSRHDEPRGPHVGIPPLLGAEDPSFLERRALQLLCEVEASYAAAR